MKKVSVFTVAMVAVCAVLVGMFITSSLGLATRGNAEPFWQETSGSAPAVQTLPSLRALAEQVRPTVVNISTTKVVSGRNLLRRFPGPGGQDDMFDDFFHRYFGEEPQREMRQSSLGSGFVISEDGYILTNFHVVDGAEEILVSLSDKEEFAARLVGSDDKTDVALIKIDTGGKKLPAAVLGDSDDLEIGDWVIAVGNPFGLGHTLTQGIVSAKARIIGAGPYDNFIQTDAAINPGNSGGPLLDLGGRVVGINTAIVASGQGIGFAIPINMVKGMLAELRERGEVSRGWLGVAIQEVTPDIARAVGLEKMQGAMITTVYDGDPAARAGVKNGDIILEINGETVEDHHALTRMVGKLKPGSAITLVVWRDGRELSLDTTLDERSDKHLARLEKQPRQDQEVQDRLGLTVKSLDAEQARLHGLEQSDGVIVLKMEPRGAGGEAHVQIGDVIIEVAGEKVKDAARYQDMLKKLKSGQTVLLRLMREGMPLFVAVDIP